MNDPTDTPPSKGQLMIAAYRAARLSQRPVFRSSLHETHVARRTARAQGHARPDPVHPAPADPPPVVSVEVPVPENEDAGSVFANLISIAVAERQTEAESRTGNAAFIDAADGCETGRSTGRNSQDSG